MGLLNSRFLTMVNLHDLTYQMVDIYDDSASLVTYYRTGCPYMTQLTYDNDIKDQCYDALAKFNQNDKSMNVVIGYYDHTIYQISFNDEINSSSKIHWTYLGWVLYY
jgi:hypothetical protein